LAYHRIPGLQEFLYVETERVGATVYRRAPDRSTTIALAREDRLRVNTGEAPVGKGNTGRH